MYIERSKNTLFSLTISLVLHLFLAAIGYLVISGKNQEISEDAISIEMVTRERRKAPRPFMHKEPVSPAPPSTVGLGHKMRIARHVDLPRTYADIGLSARETGLIPPEEDQGRPFVGDILVMEPVNGVRFDRAIRFTAPSSRPEPDLIPEIKPESPGLQSFLLSSSSPQIPPGSMEDLIQIIRRKLESAKRYPPEARRAGYEGTAVVSFTINFDGTLSDVRVISSSGYPVLDRAAVMTIKRAAPFPSLKSYTIERSLTLEVPITFRLKEDSR